MMPKIRLHRTTKTLHAQTILATEATYDEEEQFLQANPLFVPLFEIDVYQIYAQYSSPNVYALLIDEI